MAARVRTPPVQAATLVAPAAEPNVPVPACGVPQRRRPHSCRQDRKKALEPGFRWRLVHGTLPVNAGPPSPGARDGLMGVAGVAGR